MKLVLVEWLDSHSGRGWQSPRFVELMQHIDAARKE